MSSFSRWIFLGVLALVFAGCATVDQSESDSVSTIPWNRPASWEGQGALGGMMMMQQQGR
jgi:hypothetical protein